MHPDALSLLPEGEGFLLVEFGAQDRKASDDRAREFVDGVRRRRPRRASKLYDDPAHEKALWKVRESGLGATAMVAGQAQHLPRLGGLGCPARAPRRLPPRLRGLLGPVRLRRATCTATSARACCTAGSTSTSPAEGVAAFRAYLDDAADLVVGMGGSLSGEHGDGQARGELLPRMYGDELVGAFEELKAHVGPGVAHEPGQDRSPQRPVADLRIGPTYAPPAVQTAFGYPDDDGTFGHAAMRCVGVGECRRHEGGVMCPSYMVTREERHSTRGRARLLFELLNGGELEGGWRNDEVAEALDLCLACKGCKGDCPVNVDMATYKAEFMAHHYAGRLRPRAAYSMGLIHWWAKLASRAPRLVNVAGRMPVLGSLAKVVAGVAPERELPAFADRTFRASWARRGGRVTEDPGEDGSRSSSGAASSVRADSEARGARRVILWVDTFTDHFHPRVADAAVRVLEDAGCEVILPSSQLCCGRPLYDWGFLGQAKRLLRTTLRDLRSEIRAGTPIVGLEPSCVSVFRDEAPNLLPGNVDAARIASQTWTLTEYLAGLDGYQPPRLEGRALVHGHCHHRSVLDFDAERRLLESTGLSVEVPDSGCCGMAGAFGFERGEHYRVSIAAGERVLLPAVRAAEPGTFVVTGGFSCREQIVQTTGHPVLHPAELLARGLSDGRAAGTKSASMNGGQR